MAVAFTRLTTLNKKNLAYHAKLTRIKVPQPNRL